MSGPMWSDDQIARHDEAMAAADESDERHEAELEARDGEPDE